MADPFPPDVQKLLQEQRASGGYGSEDDLLRDALIALNRDRRTIIHDDPETFAGLQRGLDEMKQGLGRPFEEFDAEFRAKRNLNGDA